MKTVQKINTLYGRLPPKNIAGLKLWDMVHVELIGLYSKSIRQQQPVVDIINNDVSLTSMTMIDPTMVWFEIIKFTTYGIYEVMDDNDENIDKSSARVIQLFNNTWIIRYPHTRKVVFGNGSEFKREFTTFLKDFDI